MVASPLDVKVTTSLGTRPPLASVTVAVAADVDVPVAGILAGERTTPTVVAAPNSVRVAVVESCVDGDVSVAVMVSVSAVVDAVMLAV